MKVEIKRIRYAVVNDKNEIFCGLAKAYKFKSIDNIGDTAIKTYLSENKAKASFLDSWYGSKKEDFETGKYKIVKVIESLSEVSEDKV